MRSERRAAEGDGRAAHMRRYRLELMLGTVFLAVFLAFYMKVSPGPKLTREKERR